MIKLKEVYYVMGWMKKKGSGWVGQHLISFSFWKMCAKTMELSKNQEVPG